MYLLYDHAYQEAFFGDTVYEAVMASGKVTFDPTERCLTVYPHGQKFAKGIKDTASFSPAHTEQELRAALGKRALLLLRQHQCELYRPVKGAP